MFRYYFYSEVHDAYFNINVEDLIAVIGIEKVIQYQNDAIKNCKDDFLEFGSGDEYFSVIYVDFEE